MLIKKKKKKTSTLAEELHKPIRRKFKKRRVLVNGIDKIWAVDLVDMQAFSKFNRRVKDLLAVIDVLIPLKDNTGKSVASALKTIFEERKLEKMWVDKGKEFYNKDVKDLIELYSTENKEKSSVVERWIRTMKEKMWKYFTANSTNVYLNQLSDLVKEYNNTGHSSIRMTPVKASKKKTSLLKNIPDPIDGKDAVNKAYVDDRTIQPAAPIKPIITVWAEEKGLLGNGHYEFSFGNGSSGSEHAYGGYCMSAPGRIIRGSLTANESRNILLEEVKVNIVVYGKEQVNQSIVKKSGDICSCSIFRDPIELNQCDVINLISRTANSKITNAYVSILIELDL